MMILPWSKEYITNINCDCNTPVVLYDYQQRYAKYETFRPFAGVLKEVHAIEKELAPFTYAWPRLKYLSTNNYVNLKQ